MCGSIPIGIEISENKQILFLDLYFTQTEDLKIPADIRHHFELENGRLGMDQAIILAKLILNYYNGDCDG